MPIQIIDGFKLGTSKPIDDRIVASGSQARDNIMYKYDGLLVVDTKDRIPYIWNADSSTWSSFIIPQNNSTGTYESIKEITNNNNKYVYVGTPNPSFLSSDKKINISGGLKSDFLYGDGGGITNINPANISPGSNGQVLQISGGKPTWSTISVGSNIVSTSVIPTTTYYLGFIDKTAGGISNIYNQIDVRLQNGVFYNNLNTSLGGTLTVAGVTTLNGNLTVATGKTTTLNGNTQITGANTFTVGTGATVLGGTLTVTGVTTLTGTLAVTGATTLNSNLTVGSETTLNGNTQITGAKTFTVGTGATVLGGTLTVNGDMTSLKKTQINGNATITGLTTLGGATTPVALTVTGGSGYGATTLGGTLTVADVTTLNGNLIVATGKTTTLGGTLTVTGTSTTTLGGTLTVADVTTLNGNLTVATGKTTTLNGNTQIAGASTFTVGTGKTTIGGGITLKGGNLISKIVVGSVNVARNGTHAINKGSNFVQIGGGNTSGIVPVVVIKLKTPMPSANYSVFVSFSHSVNAFQWVCVAEVLDSTNFKICVSRTVTGQDWSGVLEVSFMAVCYEN